MFKNRINAKMYASKPEMDSVFQKFESFFYNGTRELIEEYNYQGNGYKILQFIEDYDYSFKTLLAQWEMFASAFILYKRKVYCNLNHKEILIELEDDDSLIMISIKHGI